jgi:hypothetical protein
MYVPDGGAQNQMINPDRIRPPQPAAFGVVYYSSTAALDMILGLFDRNMFGSFNKQHNRAICEILALQQGI